MSSTDQGVSSLQPAPAQETPASRAALPPSYAALGWALALGSTVAFSFAPP